MKAISISKKLKRKYLLIEFFILIFTVVLVGIYIFTDKSLSQIINITILCIVLLYAFAVGTTRPTFFPVLLLHENKFNAIDMKIIEVFIYFWKPKYREITIDQISNIELLDEGVHITLNDNSELGYGYTPFEPIDKQCLRDYFSQVSQKLKAKQS